MQCVLKIILLIFSIKPIKNIVQWLVYSFLVSFICLYLNHICQYSKKISKIVDNNIFLNNFYYTKINHISLKFSNFIHNSEYDTIHNNNEFKKKLIKCYNDDLKYTVVNSKLNSNFIKKMKNFYIDDNNLKDIIKIVNFQLNLHRLKKNYKCNFLIMCLNSIGNKIALKNKIVGLEICYKNKKIYGILFKNGKFFDIQGINLISSFLQFPFLKKFRVSSKFSLHRLNPITKKIIPHRGTDFAMPIGTPIISVSNGTILETKSSIQAGNYITIRHDNSYITKYMHLKKILIKKGHIVKIGEQIGLSGSTGYSTGPHLHYEIWINNKAINPEKFQAEERLTKNNLKEHINFSKIIISYFEKSKK